MFDYLPPPADPSAPLGPKRKPHLQMIARNRQLLAERLRWPAGALNECLRIEKAFPGWSAAWFGEWTLPGFERAEGFYAWRDGDDPGYTDYSEGKPRWVRRREVYGITAESLERALGGKLP